nr:putative glucose-6-phosphate 1-epimerase [Tanacetum cinerariifolium]
MCEVLSHDNSLPLDVSKDQFEDFSNSNEEFSSTDDDSFSIDNIDYVKASPLDSELVSSEVMEIVILKVRGIKASNDNPIHFYYPIISGTPPNLTPSGESDFLEFCWTSLFCSFEFRLRVSLGMDGNLTLISRIRNVNGKPFSFSFGYHSHLSVSDISEVRIEGLETI